MVAYAKYVMNTNFVNTACCYNYCINECQFSQPLKVCQQHSKVYTFKYYFPHLIATIEGLFDCRTLFMGCLQYSPS